MINHSNPFNTFIIISYDCRNDDFELVSGRTSFKVERMSPGVNTSQTIVVRPRKFGYFNFTAAEVRIDYYQNQFVIGSFIA